MPTQSQIFPTSAKRKNILDAARHAVAKDRPKVTPGFEAHHVGEKFATIWDKFAKANPQLVGPDLVVKVNAMGKYPKFIDSTISREFRKFHAEQVEWQVLSHADHLAIHQAEDAARNAANATQISADYTKWAKTQNPQNIIPFDPTGGIARSFEGAALNYADYISESLDKFVSYNMINKQAVAWVSQYAAQEIKYLDAAQRDTIRNIKQIALQEGMTIAEQNKLISQQIGLLPNHVIAVQNYKDQLKSAGMDAATAEKKAAKYADKLLKYRADTIGLTESENAMGAAKKLTNQDLINRGIISKDDYMQQWVTAPDERRCPQCGALQGQQCEIGEAFPGGLDQTPAHQRCRCVIVLVSKKLKPKGPQYSVPTSEDAKDYTGLAIGNEPDPLGNRWLSKQNQQLAMRPESLKVNALTKEEKATFQAYSSHTNQKINKYLNGGMDGVDPKDLDLFTAKRETAKMDALFEKLRLDSNLKAYRGLSPSMDTLNDALGKALDSPGSILQMKGFVSTSISPDQAARFASKTQGRMLEILLPKGTPGAYIRSVSASASEEELLLGRGLTFIVGDTRKVAFTGQDGAIYDRLITTIKAVLPEYSKSTGAIAAFEENTAFVAQLTSAAATEWRTIFKTKYPELQVYLNGMDEELQLRAYLSMNKVLKDIPDPQDVLQKIWTQKQGEGFFTGLDNAYAAAAEKEIQLNLGYFSNKDTIMSYIKNDIATGFHPEGFSPEWIVTHEMGHTVFNAFKLYDEETGKAALGIINEARKSGELAKWGKYAASSPDEAFAEIFAGIYHSPTSTMPQFVKDIKKLILG